MLRLLVIDDEETALRSIRRAFRTTPNLSIETICGGLDGMAAVLRGGFDVLITDLHMPNVNGAELLALAEKSAPDAYRILLTGSDGPLHEMPAHLVVRKLEFETVRRGLSELAAQRAAA